MDKPKVIVEAAENGFIVVTQEASFIYGTFDEVSAQLTSIFVPAPAEKFVPAPVEKADAPVDSVTPPAEEAPAEEASA